MTNAALQALIDANSPEALVAIKFDNNCVAYFGYKDSNKYEDMTLETIGGVDFVVLKKKNMQGRELDFISYNLTDTIQNVIFMDPKDVDYRIDPLILK